MNNVIYLDEYKKQKDKDELDELSQLVKDMMKDLNVDTTPQPYYDDKMTNIGLCIDSLLFTSDSLLEMGYVDLSNNIDNLIVKLSTEQNNC